ncbi:extracellular solute-binding protein [Paenibacillus sp. LHD-117]|uniref:extracellular solute-binding protein n=1 Tax=Paenibacillus sp. LHD-117 TaxID=3071412 RepID=UPI0027DF6965|nr:extracellular solute-binding protein [Paenibacillus sp. LHD-117]MDQ6419989.1 extracellular solute-binding protein [Paenibacillus sp. LHD-117]
MRSRKMVLSLVLIMTLIILLAAGCGKAPSTEEKNGESETNNAAKPETADEKMKLHFWTFYPEQTKIDGYYMNALKEKFNFDAEFYVASPDTSKEKLNLSIASGDTPDWWKGLNYQEYDKLIEQDVVAEIKLEDLQQYAPKYLAFLQKVLGDDPFQYLRRDGKIYGLPGVWDLAPTGKVVGFRQDWLSKVGIAKTPETIEEMEDALTKFRHDDPDGNGNKDTYGVTGTAADINGLFDFVFGAYGVYPGAFTEENGTVVRGEIMPGAKEALTVLNRWYKNELIDPEFIVNKDSNVQDKMIQEKAGAVSSYWFGLAPDGVFCCNDIYTNLHKNNPNAGFAMIPGPKGPEGKFGMVQGNALFGVDIMFGKQLEKDHDKMIKYLQVFEYTSFDLEAIIARTYGEEGKTFKKTADGNYEFIPPYDDQKERWKYGFDGAYSVPGGWNDDFNEELAAFNTKDKSLLPMRNELIHMGKGKYDILGPIVKPVFNDHKERLDKLTMQTFLDMITGKKPVSDFDNYVAEWREMGGDKVMAEAQQAYEELMAQ